MIEKNSQGYILRTIYDTDQSMGVAYERALNWYKPNCKFTRSSIIFPRASSRIQITLPPLNQSQNSRKKFIIDSSQFLLVPPHTTFDMRASSALCEALILLPSQKYMDDIFADNPLDRRDQLSLVSECHHLVRTRWMDDLIERYFFERFETQAPTQNCTYFLEKQILNEMARIVFKERFTPYGESIGIKANNTFEQVVKFIEANLFEKIDSIQICEQANTDASTLRRLFKDHLNTTPGAYIKDRRLDEAAALLTRGNYSIPEIGMLIGYDDFSSFIRAFKAKFGQPPGSYRSTQAGL